MASLRSKFYSRMLRRTFRGRGFGEGLEALKRVRSGEDRSFILSLLSQSAHRTQPPRLTAIMPNGWATLRPSTPALSAWRRLYYGRAGHAPQYGAGFGTLCQCSRTVAGLSAGTGKPFPAAIEDAEAAYDWLLEQGVRRRKCLSPVTVPAGLSLR